MKHIERVPKLWVHPRIGTLLSQSDIRVDRVEFGVTEEPHGLDVGVDDTEGLNGGGIETAVGASDGIAEESKCLATPLVNWDLCGREVVKFERPYGAKHCPVNIYLWSATPNGTSERTYSVCGSWGQSGSTVRS